MRVRVRSWLKGGCLWIGAVLLVGAVVGNWLELGYFFTQQRAGASTVVFAHITNNELAMTQIVWVPAQVKGREWVCGHPGTPRRWLPVGRFAGPGFEFILPTWWPAATLLAAGGVFWLLDRRRAAHECPKCRYDRRGLEEGAVCPECGSTPPPQTLLSASATPR